MFAGNNDLLVTKNYLNLPQPASCKRTAQEEWSGSIAKIVVPDRHLLQVSALGWSSPRDCFHLKGKLQRRGFLEFFSRFFVFAKKKGGNTKALASQDTLGRFCKLKRAFDWQFCNLCKLICLLLSYTAVWTKALISWGHCNFGKLSVC